MATDFGFSAESDREDEMPERCRVLIVYAVMLFAL